jgi:hypothetical protein
MEKLFGPFSGYFAVVCVRETTEVGGKFAASYRICRGVPADYSGASPAPHKSVAGLSASADEAFDIALQLARLHIAGLPALAADVVTRPVRATSSLAEFASSWGPDPQSDSRAMTYQATIPCPL